MRERHSLRTIKSAHGTVGTWYEFDHETKNAAKVGAIALKAHY